MLTITFDTNTIPLDRTLLALGNLPADLAVTSVTRREMQGGSSAAHLRTLRELPEVYLMGESEMGVAVLGTRKIADLFEKTLSAITNGSFPKPDRRSHLTPNEKRQMRDALIFCTHVREGRDIFVTDDVTAFGKPGSEQRNLFTELASTQIMTMEEFEHFCSTQR
jgi:hypothetical protein